MDRKSQHYTDAIFLVFLILKTHRIVFFLNQSDCKVHIKKKKKNGQENSENEWSVEETSTDIERYSKAAIIKTVCK